MHPPQQPAGTTPPDGAPAPSAAWIAPPPAAGVADWMTAPPPTATAPPGRHLPGGRRRGGVGRIVLVAGIAAVVAAGCVIVVVAPFSKRHSPASVATAPSAPPKSSTSQPAAGVDVDWTKQGYPYILDGAYETTGFEADGSLLQEFGGNWIAARLEGETTGVLSGISGPVVVSIVRVGSGTVGDRIEPPGERVYVWRVGSTGAVDLLATGAWQNSLNFQERNGADHGYSVETHFAIVDGLLAQYDRVVDALDPSVPSSWAVTAWSLTTLATINPYGPATLTYQVTPGDLSYPATDPAIPALSTSGTPNELRIPAATAAPSAGTTSGQPVTVSGGTGGPYQAVLFAHDVITDCAAHAYGAPVTAFFSADPCTMAHRVLATVTVGGRTAALAASVVEFPPTGTDVYGYDTARSFQELVDAEGTGNLSDLLREGDRLPSSVTAVPDHVAFLATGQDAGVWVFESWWLSGTTGDQDPALVDMENGLFLSDLFAR